LSNPRAIGLAEFIAALYGGGVRRAFVSPGARSAPLVGALAQSPIRCTPILDERVAGFAALGAAWSERRPALLVCTSGTAPLHYLPAIAEAESSGLPLLIVAADRPLSGGWLREVQTVPVPDHRLLFRVHRRVELGAELPVSGWRRLAGDLLGSIARGGAALLQVGIAEPLFVRGADVAPPVMVPDLPVAVPEPAGAGRLAEQISATSAGCIWVGAGPMSRADASAVQALARRTGFTLVADAASPVRGVCGVTGWPQATLAAGKSNRRPPELVLRSGAWPALRPAAEWLGRAGRAHWYVGDSRTLQDPHARVERILPWSWKVLAEALLPFLPASSPTRESCITDLPEQMEKETEDRIAEAWVRSSPAGSRWVIANGRPVRALDRCLEPFPADVDVFSPRGCGGIEGQLSFALGVALTGAETRVWLGDLSLLHDCGALAEIAARDLPIRVTIGDDRGGGIFRRLPLAREWNRKSERMIRAPHRHDLAAIVRGFGLPVVEIGMEDLTRGLPDSPFVLIHEDQPHLRRFRP